MAKLDQLAGDFIRCAPFLAALAKPIDRNHEQRHLGLHGGPVDHLGHTPILRTNVLLARPLTGQKAASPALARPCPPTTRAAPGTGLRRWVRSFRRVGSEARSWGHSCRRWRADLRMGSEGPALGDV